MPAVWRFQVVVLGCNNLGRSTLQADIKGEAIRHHQHPSRIEGHLETSYLIKLLNQRH